MEGEVRVNFSRIQNSIRERNRTSYILFSTGVRQRAKKKKKGELKDETGRK